MSIESRRPLTIKQINALPEAQGWWPYGMNNRVMALLRAVERAHGIAHPATVPTAVPSPSDTRSQPGTVNP